MIGSVPFIHVGGRTNCTLLCVRVHVHVDAGGDQRVVGKGKRQAWTAAAIEVFFEGLYQVLVYTCPCI